VSKLATFVHVLDENGQSHTFGPEDDIPKWAEKAITNPNAWEEPPAGGSGRHGSGSDRSS